MKWINVPRGLHDIVTFFRTEQACVDSAKFELERAEEHVRELKAHITLKECSVIDLAKDIKTFISYLREETKKSIIEEFNLDDLFPCE